MDSYENSVTHKQAYKKWAKTEIGLKTCTTIDKEEQKLIEKEYLRWQSV